MNLKLALIALCAPAAAFMAPSARPTTLTPMHGAGVSKK